MVLVQKNIYEKHFGRPNSQLPFKD